MKGARVMNAMDRIEPQNIDVEIFKPEQGVFDEKLANGGAVGSIEIDGFAPRCAISVAKIRSESAQIISFRAQMVVHNIKSDRESQPMCCVHETLKRNWASIPIVDSKRV